MSPTATAAAAPRGDTVLVPSRLFGPLHVRSDSFIRFPDGLLGFAGERHFILLPAARGGGVYWLQAVEEGALEFLLIDPFPVFPGYAFELPRHFNADPVESPAVLAIVTPPRRRRAGHRQPAGPLLLDLASRTGHQVVLAGEPYGTRSRSTSGPG